VILVVIHKPQTSPWGGKVAAPVFSSVAQQLVVLFDIPPDKIRQAAISESENQATNIADSMSR
jgi:hypothetical protein